MKIMCKQEYYNQVVQVCGINQGHFTAELHGTS